MKHRRFFVPPDSIRDGIATLPSDQAHHLRDVLRIGAGEVVEIFDGTGCGYSGKVDLRGSEVVVRGLQSLSHQESPLRIILAAALIKSAKFEWMLQKTTELGVDEIIPLKTCLSDIEIPEGKTALRLERWNRIVKEASKQCRRFSAPRVLTPMNFPNFLAAGAPSAATRLLFCENAPELWQPDPGTLSGRMVLCIGPEGGWENSEITQAKQAGYKTFSLGPSILRAETAAIAAVSIIQHQIHLLHAQT
jgi:16S rRNA (uracil1498-N3)-methyltransferase